MTKFWRIFNEIGNTAILVHCQNVFESTANISKQEEGLWGEGGSMLRKGFIKGKGTTPHGVLSLARFSCPYDLQDTHSHPKREETHKIKQQKHELPYALVTLQALVTFFYIVWRCVCKFFFFFLVYVPTYKIIPYNLINKLDFVQNINKPWVCCNIYTKFKC